VSDPSGSVDGEVVDQEGSDEAGDERAVRAPDQRRASYSRPRRVRSDKGKLIFRL
jgi:hypothetical protein